MYRSLAIVVGLLFVAAPALPADPPAEMPPMGWKEYTPKDNAFTVWIPEKVSRQSERERTSTVRGQRFKITVLHLEMGKTLRYSVEKLILPASMSKANRRELEDIFRDMIVADLRGKVTEESDVKLGPISGREYTIQTGVGLAKLRIFVGGGGRIYMIHAEGSKADIEKESTMTFLSSLRLGTAAPSGSGEAVAGARTKIQGGGGDPEFEDAGPDGAILVGIEVGLGKFFNNDTIKAARPIYRAGDKESNGEWHGIDITRTAKAVAKPGYAVGAIACKTGLGMDGLGVTFMKVTDGKLDPKDSYESEWLGGKGGGGPVKLGDGTTPIGLIGKTNGNQDLTGLGLLYKKSNLGDKKSNVVDKKSDVGSPSVKSVSPGNAKAVVGFRLDPTRNASGPEGGLLIGFEASVVNNVIKGLCPIYRVGDKESSGENKGARFATAKKYVAKPGYAVGAISAKTGLGVDGFSITFMKITETGLDPKDAYESDWIGGTGGNGPVKIGGTGTKVIGWQWKENRNKELTGVGLLFPEN